MRCWISTGIVGPLKLAGGDSREIPISYSRSWLFIILRLYKLMKTARNVLSPRFGISTIAVARA